MRKGSPTKSGGAPSHKASDADPSPPEHMDIAVRAYAQPLKQRTKRHSVDQHRPPSDWVLIFDTETTVDASQRLRFGTYLIRNEKEPTKQEQGIFYVADDSAALSAADIETIKAYAGTHHQTLRTREDFIKNVFYEYGYNFRATIVAFNLPFDLSRLAVDYDACRQVTTTSRDNPEERHTDRTMVGGFTFQFLEQDYPRVRVKHLSSRDALYQFWVKPKFKDGKRVKGGIHRRGYFIDVKTIGAALLGAALSLKKLGDKLEVAHRKLDEDQHGGPVTSEYLDYAVRDPLTTWECFQVLRDRYEAFGLSGTPLHRLHSEASVGKAHLAQMGIKPFRAVQPDFPPTLLGIAMSAYFGGRSEVHARRTPVQILYCDFLSMYPTVSALMGLWGWVKSNGVDWTDATSEVAALLDRVSLADLQDPKFWLLLTALVQVRPNKDIFPVRSKYGDDEEQYRLALNHLTSKKPLWYTLADCIASKLLTGHAPNVIKAVRFTPREVQDGLQPIDIAGRPEFHIDPKVDDFYKRLIDLRIETKRRMKGATTEEEKSILKNEQLALKNLASATTYGIFIEINVEGLSGSQPVKCFGPGEPFETTTERAEKLGTYFHPLVSAFTTGAARLMLATAEKLSLDAGLDWAFCDTDSMALAKPTDMDQATFYERAGAVRDWFTPLNPYAQKGPIFKTEDENFRIENGKLTSELEPLYCYAISPKRYALFNRGKDGRPIIRKALAHGLGHLMQPLEQDPIPPSIPQPPVDIKDMEISAWQYCLWYRIIEAALAGHPNQPKIDDLPGFDRPAASRYGAATPDLLDWFNAYNKALSFTDQVKPFNFMLGFQAKLPLGRVVVDGKRPLSKNTRRRFLQTKIYPIAPFDRDPAKAATQCFDRQASTPKEIVPIPASQLETYAEALAQYHLHPDVKFAEADYFDRGATRRRHVIVGEIVHIGKEADRLEEQEALGPEPDTVIDYGAGERRAKSRLTNLRAILRTVNLSSLERVSGKSRQTLISIRDGKSIPRAATLTTIERGVRRMIV